MRNVSVVAFMLTLGPAGLSSQLANDPLVIPQGPMCTQEALDVWQRIDTREQGAEVRHTSRHAAPHLSAARQIYWGPISRGENYMALEVQNQTLCGRVVKDQRFFNDGWLRFVRWVPERDWNMYIEPDPPFRGLIARPWPPPRECSREKDRADDRCLETEVTPHSELREFLKPLASLEQRTVCVYGVHVFDAGHDGGKPEIHPALAAWLDSPDQQGFRQRRVYIVQDGSRRFDKESYFAAPEPPAWAGSPLEVVYRVSLRLPAQERTQVEVRSPIGHGLTVAQGSGQANQRAIVLGGRDAGTLTIAGGFERFASVEPRDFCRSGSDALGYLEISMAVVGAEIGNPGFAVVDVSTGPASSTNVGPLRASAHALAPPPLGSLEVVPGSVRQGPSGLVADFVLNGSLANSFAPQVVLGVEGLPAPRIVETPIQGGGQVRLVTGIPISDSDAGGTEQRASLASIQVEDGSAPFPKVRLEVAAYRAEPELGELDGQAWPGFLEQAGVRDAGEVGRLALHRVRRWTVETVGGYVPENQDGNLGAAEMDLAFEANLAERDFLDRAGWVDSWRSPTPSDLAGAALSWDGATVTLDLTGVGPGSHTWNLSSYLPGLEEESAEVASHVIALADGDEVAVLRLLRGPTEALAPAASQGSSIPIDRFGEPKQLDDATRAVALGSILRRFGSDGLLTFAELRSLSQMVEWWRQAVPQAFQDGS